MATRLKNPTRQLSAEQIFQLARLSPAALLTQAKADYATVLAAELLARRASLEEWGQLGRYLGAIRVLREKTAKAAGHQLALMMGGMLGDGGKDLCTKLAYCEQRQSLREKLERIRKAITIADVVADLADLAGFLATLVDALASLKLPATMVFLILLYALDELCDCASFDTLKKRGRSFDL